MLLRCYQSVTYESTFLNIMMSFSYASYKADDVISNIILHLSVITLYKMVILH